MTDSNGTVQTPVNVTTIDSSVYQPAGNFTYGENSSLEELSIVLGQLSGQAIDNSFTPCDGMYTSLDLAGSDASSIAEIFAGANGSISASWNNISDMIYKIDKKVVAIISELTTAIKTFIDTSQKHEQLITRATSTANELAEKVLSDLGL